MKRDYITDEQVEIEIDRLLHSEEVRIAKREASIKYKRRQYMYTLRTMEKRGRVLMENGLSMDSADDEFLGLED